LISASVASVNYYGFSGAGQEVWLVGYTVLSVLTGVVGSVIPFQAWFNERRNKVIFGKFVALMCD
jgi:adiponectin receptor